MKRLNALRREGEGGNKKSKKSDAGEMTNGA